MIRKDEVRDYLKGLENDELLETLYLFGSFANDPENPVRDLDLAVIFSPEGSRKDFLG